MTWSGEFHEAPELATKAEIQEVRELYEGTVVRVLQFVRGDEVTEFGEAGDSIFLSEIKQVKPGQGVYLVDGRLLLNDCLFDVEVL